MAPSLEILDSTVPNPEIHEKQEPIVSAAPAISELSTYEAQVQYLQAELQSLESELKPSTPIPRTQFQLEDRPIDADKSIKVRSPHTLPQLGDHS